MRYCCKDQPQNSGRTESTNNNLVNETMRVLKDCFQADRKSDLEALVLAIGAVYGILHACSECPSE